LCKQFDRNRNKRKWIIRNEEREQKRENHLSIYIACMYISICVITGFSVWYIYIRSRRQAPRYRSHALTQYSDTGVSRIPLAPVVYHRRETRSIVSVYIIVCACLHVCMLICARACVCMCIHAYARSSIPAHRSLLKCFIKRV